MINTKNVAIFASKNTSSSVIIQNESFFYTPNNFATASLHALCTKGRTRNERWRCQRTGTHRCYQSS